MSYQEQVRALKSALVALDDIYHAIPGRRRLRQYNKAPSKTRQSEKQAADINNIVRRFADTGYLPPAKHQGTYADVTDLQTGEFSELATAARQVVPKAIEAAKRPRKPKATPSTTASEASSSDAGATPNPTPPEA